MTRRHDDRLMNEIRHVEIIPNFIPSAAGSCLISCGKTRVICTASVDEKVPQFLENAGLGWLTAEYNMLPASTGARTSREKVAGAGRTHEIQLGQRTITIDCDVIQADGGTRTASITGGYVALVLAIDKLMRQKLIEKSPIVEQVAAISLGKVKGELLLDLDFVEDSSADIDANLVSTPQGNVIEWQTTAERALLPFSELGAMVELGLLGIRQLCEVQNAAIEAHRAAMAHETPRT